MLVVWPVRISARADTTVLAALASTRIIVALFAWGAYGAVLIDGTDPNPEIPLGFTFSLMSAVSTAFCACIIGYVFVKPHTVKVRRPTVWDLVMAQLILWPATVIAFSLWMHH
jgi:hypothetical protein